MNLQLETDNRICSLEVRCLSELKMWNWLDKRNWALDNRTQVLQAESWCSLWQNIRCKWCLLYLGCRQWAIGGSSTRRHGSKLFIYWRVLPPPFLAKSYWRDDIKPELYRLQTEKEGNTEETLFFQGNLPHLWSVSMMKGVWKPTASVCQPWNGYK